MTDFIKDFSRDASFVFIQIHEVGRKLGLEFFYCLESILFIHTSGCKQHMSTSVNKRSKYSDPNTGLVEKIELLNSHNDQTEKSGFNYYKCISIALIVFGVLTLASVGFVYFSIPASQETVFDSKNVTEINCDQGVFATRAKKLVETALSYTQPDQLKLTLEEVNFQENKFTDDTENHNFTFYHSSNDKFTEFLSFQYYPSISPEEMIIMLYFPEYKKKLSKFEKEKHSITVIQNGTDFGDIFRKYGIDHFRGDLKDPKVMSFVTPGKLMMIPEQEHVVEIRNTVIDLKSNGDSNAIVTCFDGASGKSETYKPLNKDIERVYKEVVCYVIQGHNVNGDVMGTKLFFYIWNDMLNTKSWFKRKLLNTGISMVQKITKTNAEKLRTTVEELRESGSYQANIEIAQNVISNGMQLDELEENLKIGSANECGSTLDTTSISSTTNAVTTVSSTLTTTVENDGFLLKFDFGSLFKSNESSSEGSGL